MRNHLLILILLAFILSCTGQKKPSATYDKKIAVINDPKYIKWITGKDFEMWKPEKVDLIKVNDILIDAINNSEFYFLKSKNISELKKNYRQYLCYVNEKGEKIVYVNSMCELCTDYDKDNKPIQFDWKNEISKTADGGSCYWNVKINITTNKYYDLVINWIS